MSERIKSMTVQQLLDAGFKVTLIKYNCGDNPSLEAKQWLDAPVTYQRNYSVWATNWSARHDPNPKVSFFK